MSSTHPSGKTSQKRLEANRRNARKSTGPQSEGGKNRSKTNALRHGLTAQVMIMTDADRDAHEKFTRAYIADLAPEGAQETYLAQSIAFDAWRLNRARAIEENAFSLQLEGDLGNFECNHPQIHAAVVQSRTFSRDPHTFALLTLYEQRIGRAYHKNLALLRQLRKERVSTQIAPPASAEEPLTMAAGANGHAETTPETPAQVAEPAAAYPASTSPEDINPLVDGFVSSKPEIATDSRPNPAGNIAEFRRPRANVHAGTNRTDRLRLISLSTL